MRQSQSVRHCTLNVSNGELKRFRLQMLDGSSYFSRETARRKTFEHFTVWVDRRRSTVKRTRDKIIRLAVVLTTMAAWFSISNHCAVGGLIAKTNSAVAPMHCHGNQPTPSKKSSEEEMPCCKVLRATLAGEAKVVEVASQNLVPIQDWVVAELLSTA